MTTDEAQRIAEVLACVDGGCPSCTEDAAEDMAREFPEFAWRKLVREIIRRDRG